MTMASGRMATSVFKVSTSDSPFETLDACAVMETASAPSRLAAISKLVRVRVDASKNRLTIMRPLQNRAAESVSPGRGLKVAGAFENRLDLGARPVLSIPSKACGMAFPPRRSVDPFHQQDFFHAVDLLEFYFDDFVVRWSARLRPDEAGLDGQFAMAAVDQDQQLHARRDGPDRTSASSAARIGAAGVENVIHQDDVLARHGEIDFGGVEHGLRPTVDRSSR